MNLLLVKNLSPRLVPRLSSLFSGLIHVRDVGLKQATDQTIWVWAAQNDYSIVTTDSDFVLMSRERGKPPKIIHVEQCHFPLRIIEDLLRRNAVKIAEFHKNEGTNLLVLRI